MISTVLLVVHIIFVAAMIGLILIQKSEGGALGMGGGNFMSARGTANLLTRSTAVLATLFFLSTLILAMQFKGSKTSTQISTAIEAVEQKEASTSMNEAPSLPVDAEKPTLPAVDEPNADGPAAPSSESSASESSVPDASKK